MNIVFKLIIYVSIFTTAYLILSSERRIEKKKIKELKKIKKGVDEKRSEEKIIELIKKIPFYRSQNEIDKTGNSLGLTPTSYLICKTLPTGIAFSIVLYFIKNIILGIFAGLCGFFVIDLLLKIDKNMEIDMIRLDLADVTNQIKSNANGENIEIAIANSVTSICKSKKLKREYIVLSSEIITTGRTLEALEIFRKKFDYEEIDEFVSMLQQAIESGTLESQLNGFLLLIQEDNNKYIKRQIAKLPSKVNTIGYYFTMVIFVMFLVVTVTLAFSGAGAIFKN